MHYILGIDQSGRGWGHAKRKCLFKKKDWFWITIIWTYQMIRACMCACVRACVRVCVCVCVCVGGGGVFVCFFFGGGGGGMCVCVCCMTMRSISPEHFFVDITKHFKMRTTSFPQSNKSIAKQQEWLFGHDIFCHWKVCLVIAIPNFK